MVMLCSVAQHKFIRLPINFFLRSGNARKQKVLVKFKIKSLKFKLKMLGFIKI